MPCLGDANADGSVNFLDVTTLLANFGSQSTGCLDLVCGDADGNGIVNFLDQTTVLANFGTLCPKNAVVPCSSYPVPGGGSGGEGSSMMVSGSNTPGVGDVLNALAVMGYQGIDEFVAAIMTMPTHERNAEVQRLGQMLMQGSGQTE